MSLGRRRYPNRERCSDLCVFMPWRFARMFDKREYEKRIRELIRQAKDVSPEATRAALKALQGAHDEVLREIAGLPSEASSYSRYQLQGLRRATERAMEDFERHLKSEITGAQNEKFLAGRENVDRTLRDAISAPATLADLSRTQLLVAQGYTADLVTGLSAAAKARLNSTIQRAFLGGQSVTDIIKEIGRSLGDGQFGIISRRAETIYRTEVLRVASMATQARLEQAVERGVPVQKMWIHAGMPARVRWYHRAIDREVASVHETFAGSGPNSDDDLMYPLDPKGAAADTVNCGCIAIPWVESFAKFAGVTTPA